MSVAHEVDPFDWTSTSRYVLGSVRALYSSCAGFDTELADRQRKRIRRREAVMRSTDDLSWESLKFVWVAGYAITKTSHFCEFAPTHGDDVVGLGYRAMFGTCWNRVPRQHPQPSLEFLCIITLWWKGTWWKWGQKKRPGGLRARAFKFPIMSLPQRYIDVRAMIRWQLDLGGFSFACIGFVCLHDVDRTHHDELTTESNTDRKYIIGGIVSLLVSDWNSVKPSRRQDRVKDIDLRRCFESRVRTLKQGISLPNPLGPVLLALTISMISSGCTTWCTRSWSMRRKIYDVYRYKTLRIHLGP